MVWRRCRARSRARRAGRRAATSCGEPALHGLTFGPDPATHALHPRRHDRQQLLRRALAHGRQDGREHRSLEILTYDGARLASGRPARRSSRPIIGDGGRAGRDLRQAARACATATADDPRRFPKIPRRVSGYNLDQLLPENGFNVARALVGREGTCVTMLEAELRARPRDSPPRARAARARLPRHLPRPPTIVPQVLATRPIGLEGLDDRLVDAEREEACHPATSRCLPEGNAWLMVEFGGDYADEADAQGPDADRAFMAGGDHPTDVALVDDPAEQRASGRPRGRPRRTALVRRTSPRPWSAGRTPRSRRMRSATTCATSSAVGRLRLPRLALRALRRGLHPRAHRLRPAHRRGHRAASARSWSEAADLVVALRRLALRRARRRPGARRVPAEDVRPRAGRRVPRVQGASGIPTGRMNPGKIVDPLPSGRRTCASGPTTSRPQPTTHFRFARRRRLRARACALRRHRASAGGRGRHHVPELPGDPRGAHSTRGRARLLFEMLRRRGRSPAAGGATRSRRRSTCAWPARAARATARPNVDMATYKAEFLSHYYEGRLRPRRHYSMGWLPVRGPCADRSPGLVNAVLSRSGPWAGQTPGRRRRPGRPAVRAGVLRAVVAGPRRGGTETRRPASRRPVAGHFQHVLPPPRSPGPRSV